MIPAASCSGSSPPGAIKLCDAPGFARIVFDGVRGQSAHLNTRVVTAEFGEGHPGKIERKEFSLCIQVWDNDM